jgi:Phage integrase family
VVGAPKTDAGNRDVTVPPHVAKLLREHMKAHTGHGPEAFVFTTTQGKRLSKTAFTKTIKKGFASVGKPDMRVHDLRHVGATLAAQAGPTTKELMSRIGTPPRQCRCVIRLRRRKETPLSLRNCLSWLPLPVDAFRSPLRPSAFGRGGPLPSIAAADALLDERRELAPS